MLFDGNKYKTFQKEQTDAWQEQQAEVQRYCGASLNGCVQSGDKRNGHLF